MSRVLTSTLVCFAVLLIPCATAQTLPPDFTDEIAFSGLVDPTAIAFASDGRVFVAEKSGLIKVFADISSVNPTVFADLRTKVHNFWDRGLLGLALHPNFPSTPYVYVLYTHDAAIGGTAPRWGTVGGTVDNCPTPPGPTSDGCVVSGRLSRLQAAGSVMTGAEQVLIEDWCQQYPSHSIGSLAFGPDGALYVSGGDGASFNFVDYGQDGSPRNPCGDPPVGVGGVQSPPTAAGGSLRSQSVRRAVGQPRVLGGSVLRVDPATGNALPDNPMALSPDVNERRIVAYGLRNPFRISARTGTSEIWIGDVGWNDTEEINRVMSPTGTVQNFGWPCFEGTVRQSGYDSANLDICEGLYGTPEVVTHPTFHYQHLNAVVPGESCPSGSSSISGLAFYSGSSYPPDYDGALFFSDYSRNCIWAMLHPPSATGSTPSLSFGFNEGNGPTSADLSGHNRTATLVGGAAWTTTAVSGNAVQLNGTTAYLSIANPGMPTGDFTASVWVNLTSTTSWQNLMEMLDPSSRGWELDLEPGGRLTLWSDNVFRFTTTASVPLNTWTYVTLRRQADTWRVFINGIAQPQSATDATAFAFGACPFYIGVDADIGCTGGLNGHLQGRVDEVRVHSRALSDAEIQVDMKTPVGPTVPTPPPSIQTFVAGADGPVDMKIGPNGDLFYVAINTGTIRRVRYAGTLANRPPTAVAEATPISGPAPLTVTFDGTGSSDPDPGDTISFAWDLDGDGQFDDSTDAQPVVTYSDGTYTVRLEVTDEGGASSVSASIVITVGTPNTPPTVTIDQPLTTATWRVGDVIAFSGQATDSEDGALPDSALTWTLILHHCPSNCHEHHVTDFVGVASGTFTAPDHEYPSHLELRLTAIDSEGGVDIDSVSINPQTVALSFQSSPSGLQLSVGSSVSVTPFDRTVIVGSTNSTSAPSPQTIGGSSYQFVSWSDFGAQTHDIIAPAEPTAYLATYTVTSVTAFPTGTSIISGTLSSGSASALASNDNVYYVVNSTTSGTRTTAWYGSFFGVPAALSNLRVNYAGNNSNTCTQTVAIWNWMSSTWVQLDSRSVGATEVAINNLIPTGVLSNYVSAAGGEVRVRVRCTRSGSFSARGDFLSIVYDPGAPPPPGSGPVLSYGFNEGSGTTSADLSGNNRPATLVGGAAWTTTAVSGNAVQLNGTTAHISVANPGMPTGDLTVSAWVNLTSTTSWQNLMEIHDTSSSGWELDLEPGGRLTLWTSSVFRFTTTASVPLNTWTYVTLRRQGGTWQVLLNGVTQPQTATDAIVFAFGGCPFYIGVDADVGCTGGLNGHLSGRVDEVRVYSRALSNAEIQADMAAHF
jgi:PKD repeat protein